LAVVQTKLCPPLQPRPPAVGASSVSYLVGLIIAFLPMAVFVGACIVLQRRRRRRREMMIKSLYTEPETRRFN